MWKVIVVICGQLLNTHIRIVGVVFFPKNKTDEEFIVIWYKETVQEKVKLGKRNLGHNVGEKYGEYAIWEKQWWQMVIK